MINTIGQINKSKSMLLAISIIMIALAVLLWWTVTLVSVILLIGVIILIPRFFIKIPLPAKQPIKVKRKRVSPVDETIGRVLSFEMSIDEAIQKNTEQEFLSDMDLRIPVNVIEGVQEKHVTLLNDVGIVDTDVLALEDKHLIESLCDINLDTAEQWITDAKAISIGAKISNIFDLSMVDADEMLTAITRAVKGNTFEIPEGYSLTIKKVESWIESANDAISSIDAEEIQKTIENQDR
ncbi:MAG: hypothetical protein ACTSUB_06465 [Candidatus Thorarchaeota archaeon]